MTAATIEDITRQIYKHDLDMGFIRSGAYEVMPRMLGEACKVFERQQDREVFLMGALPVCATLMRGAHVQTRKGKKGLNIAVWIYSSYAAGKGVAAMANILLEAVKHQAKEEFDRCCQQQKHLADQYRAEYSMKNGILKARIKEEYEARHEREQLIKIPSSKRTEQQSSRLKELDTTLQQCLEKPALPNEPAPVPKEDISLPLYGNVKTIRDSIEENDGHVLFFDTEADSLHMNSGEYGDLRLIFKQGIENEKSGQIFKTTGLKEWRSYISVMIAATDDQLVRFITGPRDGLFSRFLYYGFEDTDEWVSQRPNGERSYEDQVQTFQARFAGLYDAVKEMKPTVVFTERQWDCHDEEWAQRKRDALETHSALGGSIHRLGHFQLRIAATFAIMRQYERGTVTEDVICDDDSWTASRLVMARFLRGLYDAWDLYSEDQLPTDIPGHDAELQAAKVAAAKAAQTLKEEGTHTLVQIHDAILSDAQFTAFTTTWRGIVNGNAKKNRVRRLLTFIQRD